MLVLTNGGPLAIDDVMGSADAIVEAFNPAFGAPVLAQTLFGALNRWGKLPYTMYNKHYIESVDLSDYDMAKPPGRTYRYFTGEALFPYGWGLSYASFQHSCTEVASGAAAAEATTNFACTVRNVGDVAGEEVVMVYHAAGDAIRKAHDAPVPIKALCEFDRVALEPGEKTTIVFALPSAAFSLTNAAGDKVVPKGKRAIVFSRGDAKDDVSITVTL